MTQLLRIAQRRSSTAVRLGAWQLAWLAAAVFIVSASYGAMMPLLPAWLAPLLADPSQAKVARHVGLVSSLYAAGVLVGAPLWGLASDRWGRGRILIAGLIGYVASLLPLLRPDWIGLIGIYASRGTTGFFVAAVVPVVPALVAEHTPPAQRARRFAWLSAMSLLGFLFGPGLNAIAALLSHSFATATGAAEVDSTALVVLMSAALGAPMMLGLAATLPGATPVSLEQESTPASADRRRTVTLWLLNGTVMFVVSGLEVGIVLQGQQHLALSSREISLMFAECSLVMLGVNALLFFTGLLERAASGIVVAGGLVLATAGLAILAQHRSDLWMYVGISFSAAGTGVVLPTIAYLAAGASRQRLGATMGGLAAAAGLGQILGSAATGWLFSMVTQLSFAWLTLPLLATLGTWIVRPAWWSVEGSLPHSPHAVTDPLSRR